MGRYLLEGASAPGSGSPASSGHAVQVMHLELSADILDDLMNCMRRGKAAQVLFGKNPLFKYDGKSHGLQTRPERFRHEIYVDGQEKEKPTWRFRGLINQSLTVQEAEKATAGTDHALQALKNTMASIEQDREARRTVISTPEARPAKGMSKAATKPAHLKLPVGRSSSASPAVGASTPAHGRQPTSAGLDMPNEHAVKKALSHFLAVQPRTYMECRRMAHINPRKVLEKMARETNKTMEEWSLQDRAYKELDIWQFKYPEGDRKKVIDNAIKAFDRMRLSKDDPHWQKLLPPESRGQGIILSRLHLKEPAQETPTVKAQNFGKNGMPKRKEAPKKAEKEKADKTGNGPAKPRKTVKDGAREEKLAARSIAEPRLQKTEPRKERQPTKRTVAAKLTEGRKPQTKNSTSTAAGKGLLNKPKNPSPLGASPSVNASDFEDNHPVHKKLSAATSPRRDLKRKANDINGNTHKVSGVSKRLHMSSSASSSSGDDQPLKSKDAPHINGVNGRAAEGTISSASSDSSSNEKPPTLSWRQSLEMARKFNLYYQRYKKLYTDISQSAEPPSERKREELLEMHRRLEEMKRRVNLGAV